MIWLFILALSRQKYRLYRKFSWLSVREPQEDCASTGYLSLGLQNIFYNPLRYQVAYRVVPCNALQLTKSKVGPLNQTIFTLNVG